MEKKWNKSKITVSVKGYDGEKRTRNLANVIENVTTEQMTELSSIIEGLTGDVILDAKSTREDSFRV